MTVVKLCIRLTDMSLSSIATKKIGRLAGTSKQAEPSSSMDTVPSTRSRVWVPPKDTRSGRPVKLTGLEFATLAPTVHHEYSVCVGEKEAVFRDWIRIARENTVLNFEERVVGQLALEHRDGGNVIRALLARQRSDVAIPPAKADSLAGRLRAKLLDFVAEQASLAGPNERLPGSSEVLESIIGKYKTLQGEQGQFGATSMLLSIGSFIGRITLEGVGKALQTVKEAALKTWEQTNLGSTIQSQRKKAFPNPNHGTKTGSRQLAST